MVLEPDSAPVPDPSAPSGGTAVVWVNLGTPESPAPAAVRAYLKQFLSDPRVVEIPRLAWWPILHGIILPFRSSKSARKYAAIWTAEGSPLRVHTEKQAGLLGAQLTRLGHDVEVAYAMRYGSPSISDVLGRLKAKGCRRVLLLCAYPQYSASTTASVWDAAFRYLSGLRDVPELRLVKSYHDHEGYLQALQQSVRDYWDMHGRPDKLVMSFHGVPKRTVALGDPYYDECRRTADLLGAALGLAPGQYLTTFQSRFGKAEWLQPYTAPTLQKLAAEGVGRVDVICPGFPSDCLETLEEIALEGREEFLAAGGKSFRYIPCLNEAPRWISALASLAEQHLAGWPTGSSDLLGGNERRLRKSD